MRVFAVYGGLTMLGAALGGIVGAVAAWRGMAAETAAALAFLGSALIAAAIPVLLYLVGEWIGRSIASARWSVPIAVLSTVAGVPATYFILGQLVAATGAGVTLSEIIIDIFPVAGVVEGGVALFFALTTFVTAVPLVVGAVRGTRHKLFLELAFLTRKLGPERRREVQEFAHLLTAEYVRAAAAPKAA
jgi:hypothetical protein